MYETIPPGKSLLVGCGGFRLFAGPFELYGFVRLLGQLCPVCLVALEEKKVDPDVERNLLIEGDPIWPGKVRKIEASSR